MTTAVAVPQAQLPALVRLRWKMVRAERVRIGLLVLASLVPGLLCAAVIAGQLLPFKPPPRTKGQRQDREGYGEKSGVGNFAAKFFEKVDESCKRDDAREIA